MHAMVYRSILCCIGLQASWGVAKLVKAPDFDSGMRRFESFLPSQKLKRVIVLHAFIFSKGNPLWPMAT